MARLDYGSVHVDGDGRCLVVVSRVIYGDGPAHLIDGIARQRAARNGKIANEREKTSPINDRPI